MSPEEAREYAYWDCPRCGGLGWWIGFDNDTTICDCVWCRVFKICYGRYQRYRADPKTRIHVSPLERSMGVPSKKGGWLLGWPMEEYAADFEIIARRELSSDVLYTMWWLHCIKKVGWREGSRYMGYERGNWFRVLHKMEVEMGRVLSELKPYGLFPPRVYFYKDNYSYQLFGQKPAEAKDRKPYKPEKVYGDGKRGPRFNSMAPRMSDKGSYSKASAARQDPNED